VRGWLGDGAGEQQQLCAWCFALSLLCQLFEMRLAALQAGVRCCEVAPLHIERACMFRPRGQQTRQVTGFVAFSNI
jgi:hypothetical protein